MASYLIDRYKDITGSPAAKEYMSKCSICKKVSGSLFVLLGAGCFALGVRSTIPNYLKKHIK